MNTSINHPSPRILVIDDNLAIHEDFQKILGARAAAGSKLGQVEAALFGEPTKPSQRMSFRLDCVAQGQEALVLVERSLAVHDPYSLAFVDIRMPPGLDGIETIERIWQICPDMQAVICTAYSDYSWDEIINRFGHSDNLIILKKPFETVEVLQIAHALTKKWAFGRQARLRMEDLERMVQERTKKLQEEIEERAAAQEALHISEERFSKAFHSSPIPMAIQGWPAGAFLAANASFFELTGYSAEELLHRSSQDLSLWADEAAMQVATAAVGRVRNHACLLRQQSGTLRNTILWAEPIALNAKPCLLLVLMDVTEQMKLEAQLRQAQKLEIVGRLVASVAHEFNNILTIIQGHTTLLRAIAEEAKTPTESIDRIVQASDRAASFTNQLLAFSRKQPVNFKIANLSEIVRTLHRMLETSLGEHYQLRLELADRLPNARFSEGGVDQILINLIINARDAMPNGGVIYVSTRAEVIGEVDVQQRPRARTGHFVCLTVIDTGCGIAPEMINNIFDPFFTTKQLGKGTGLGLSTVQSIVEQNFGWIEVTSELGRGTTFKIFFPVCEDTTLEPAAPPATSAAPVNGAGELVLLVEDEPVVREMARAILESGGYRVIEAPDGREALKIWEQRSADIDLVVTDMVMPNGVSGGALARALQTHSPDLPVICTSGYTPDYIERDLPTNDRITFLPKPYRPRRLLEIVRQCLKDQPPKPPGSTPVVAECPAPV
ncbi:MAG TPA: response regulator [Candidatus Acidoferrum sp.]|nr:response regulator [Candidatus Acidoferrum sp.]